MALHAESLSSNARLHPALESQILALELLHHGLDNATAGPALLRRSGPQFQILIKAYLSTCLLKNCASDLLLTHSLKLFLTLVTHAPHHLLRAEISAFVSDAFFSIADSPSLENKTLALRTFAQICGERGALTEIFLSLDCDARAVDLLDRVVRVLATMVAGDSLGQHAGLVRNIRQFRFEAMKVLQKVSESVQEEQIAREVVADWLNSPSPRELVDEV